MDEDTKKNFLQQHVDNYRRAMLDIIQNNTKVLMDDIISYFSKPPLDSMDVIRNKFLDLAKKNHVVFNTEEMGVMLDCYRKEVIQCCDMISNMRVQNLSKKVNDFTFQEDTIFVFYKKDFTDLNKEIRKVLKEQLSYSFESVILKEIETIFPENMEEGLQKKIVQEISKYIKGNYQKQVLDSFDIKILVKDTILMNGIKEQGDRYLFTLKNSRLLNDFD